MFNLQNKKILVIGASGTLGSNLASILSSLGAKLIIAGRDKKRLQKLFSTLVGEGHEVRIIDVLQVDKLAEFMQSCVNDGVKLSGLVYVTGIFPYIPLRVQSVENLEYTMRINFYGFVEVVKQFSKKTISENESSIVVFSSYAAINPGKSQLAYGASKAAVDNAVMVMAKELAKRKIRVNSIRPAEIEKEESIDENLFIQDEVEELIKAQNGAIEKNQISKLVAFLLSDNAMYINGEHLDIKGLLY